MKKNEKPDEKRDFFYIIINKNDTSDVFILSLKGLKKLQAAPNNLPFQCNWSQNRESAGRSWQEAKDFLLRKWAEGITKKLENVKKGMPWSYPEYF